MLLESSGAWYGFTLIDCVRIILSRLFANTPRVVSTDDDIEIPHPRWLELLEWLETVPGVENAEERQKREDLELMKSLGFGSMLESGQVKHNV